MATSLRFLLSCLPFVFATAALAADPPGATDQPGAPETMKVASVESANAGTGDDAFAFTLVKSESGRCYAVAPPGGEGMTAGESYAVVAATDMSDVMRAGIAKDHPDCKVVDVVARVAK
jgi:hypothetical protein